MSQKKRTHCFTIPEDGFSWGQHSFDTWVPIALVRIAVSLGEAVFHRNIRVIQELLCILNLIENDLGEETTSLVSELDASLCRVVVIRHGVWTFEHQEAVQDDR